MSNRILEYPVTVCDACLKASCWLGIFLCENHFNAGTKKVAVGELRKLGLEHSDYWFKSPHTGAIDQHAAAEYQQCP